MRIGLALVVAFCMRLRPHAMRIKPNLSRSESRRNVYLYPEDGNHTNHSIMLNLSDVMHDRSIVTPTVLTQVQYHLDSTKIAYHESLREAATGHLVEILIVGALAIVLLCLIVLFPRVASSAKNFQAYGGDDIRIAQQLADNLRRTVRKLPSNRKSKSGHSKERYIALLAVEPGRMAKRSDTEVTVVQKWEGGKLAWWRDAHAFNRRDAPKGEVLLKYVVSADGGNIDKYGYCEAALHYNDGLAMKKLLLFFPSQSEAIDWAADFSKFLHLVKPPKAHRASAKSQRDGSVRHTARMIGEAVTSFSSTFLEKDDSDTDLEESDSDGGN